MTPKGQECSFRGTYLELERPSRIVETWWFEGWGPGEDAVETYELREEDGVTTLRMNMAFRNMDDRSHMTMTGPGVSTGFFYRGVRYYGVGHNEALSCFGRADFAGHRGPTGAAGPVRQPYLPFHRVGVLPDFPVGSRVILAPNYDRHRFPALVMIRDGRCFREYNNSPLFGPKEGQPYTIEIGSSSSTIGSGNLPGLLGYRFAPTIHVRRGGEFSIWDRGDYPVPQPVGSKVVIAAVSHRRVLYRVKAAGRTLLRVKSPDCENGAGTCYVLKIVSS